MFAVLTLILLNHNKNAPSSLCPFSVNVFSSLRERSGLYFVPPTSDFPTLRSHVPTQGIVEEQRLSLKNQVEELEGKTAEREKHERERTLAIK